MQIVVSNSKGGCGKSTLVASLADVLRGQIVDHDNQGTIRVSAQFTNRHVPVGQEDAHGELILHDTPPYNDGTLKALLTVATIVIIPAKVAIPDLLAISGIVEHLRSLKMTDKAVVVFNEVRKPHNNTYKRVKSFFDKNYQDIRRADTELSNLVSFRNVLEKPLEGRALDEIVSLAKELELTLFLNVQK